MAKEAKFIMGMGIHTTDAIGRPETTIAICYNEGKVFNNVYVNLTFCFLSFDEATKETLKIIDLLNS